MITGKTRNEKMNLTKAERTTLMNHIKFQQHQLDRLNGNINTKSLLLENLTEILKQKVSGDEIEDTREEGKHIDKLLRNHMINELQHKKISENYFVNARSEKPKVGFHSAILE